MILISAVNSLLTTVLDYTNTLSLHWAMKMCHTQLQIQSRWRT